MRGEGHGACGGFAAGWRRAVCSVVGGTLALAIASCGASSTGGSCALVADGSAWVLFSSSRGGDGFAVHAVRTDGTCLTRLTSGGDAFFPSASPSGTLAWMSQAGAALDLLEQPVAGGEPARLDVGGLAATAPAFSPDGRWLAFEGFAPDDRTRSDLYVIPAAGGAPRRVTDGVAANAMPTWSPDGASLYFVSTRDGGHDAYRVASAGGVVERITTGAGIVGRASVSPDGRVLAFARPASGDAFSEVVLRDLGTGAERVVSRQQDLEPVFDPSGRWLVVASTRSGHRDLWLLDAATGEAVRPLTSDAALDGDASFLLLH